MKKIIFFATIAIVFFVGCSSENGTSALPSDARANDNGPSDTSVTLPLSDDSEVITGNEIDLLKSDNGPETK